MSSTLRTQESGQPVTPRSSRLRYSTSTTPRQRLAALRTESSLDDRGTLTSMDPHRHWLEDAAASMMMDGSMSDASSLLGSPRSPLSPKSPLNIRSPRMMDANCGSPKVESPRSELIDFSQDIKAHKECLERWLNGRQPSCSKCRRDLRGLGEDVSCLLVKDAIKMFPQEKALQIAAAKGVAVRASGQKSSFRDHMRALGVCELLCEMGDRYTRDHEVLGVVLEAMANLLTDAPANQESLMAAGACELVPQWMKEYGGDKTVQMNGLRCCANLAWKNSKCQAALQENGICNLVAPAMRAFADDRLLQVEGCGAAADLAYHNPQIQNVLGSTGVCREVVQAMKTFVTDRTVQLRGAQAIANVSWNHPSNQEAFGTAGACEALVTMLTKYPDDREVQCEGCRAVDNLAWNDKTNKEKLGRIGACQAITECLTLFGGKSKTLQLQAIRAGASLASNCPLNQGLLGQAGACQLVAEAMEKNGKDRSIQCEGAEALVALIGHHVENSSLLLEAGGIRAICTALSSFNNDREICMRGLRVLANLSWTNSTEDQELGRAVGRVLCEVMVAFPKDRNLQLYGCRAIANMAGEQPSSQDILGSVGACEVLCAALKAMAEDHDVSWYALGGVANLALNHGDNISRFGKTDVCHLLKACLDRFSGKQVQLQGVRAIVCLARTTNNGNLVDQLVAADACRLVCQAMAKHPDDKSIQLYGCRAIDSLTGENGNNIQLLMNAQACHIVCMALKNHPEDREVQTQGLRAVVALAWNKNQHKLLLAQEGACHLICQALAEFAGDKDVLIYAVEAVADLSWNCKNNQDLFREREGPRLLIEGLKAFGDDLALTCEGLRAISNLCYHNPANQQQLAVINVAALVCDFMRRYKKQRGVALYGLRSIFNLAINSAENQNQLQQAGACLLIAETLKAFSTDRAIACEGCRATANMAFKHPTNQSELRAVGLPTLVLHTMRDHSEDKHVCLQGLRAIGALAYHHPENQGLLGESGAESIMWTAIKGQMKTSDNKDDIVQEALEAISSITWHHPENQARHATDPLCQWLAMLVKEGPSLELTALGQDYRPMAWEIICNLAEHANNQDKLAELGLCTTALTLLAAPEKSQETLQVRALQALGAMVSHHAGNCTRVGLAGGLEALIKVLEVHVGEKKDKETAASPLIVPACHALGSLAQHSQETVQKLIDLGAIPLLHDALVRYSSDAGVAAVACEALMYACMERPELQAQLVDEGLCEDILAALELNTRHPDLVIHACNIMAVIVKDNAAFQTRFGKADAPSSITMALEEHPNDPTVACSCCRAIIRLANGHPRNQDLFAATSVCFLICSALERYPTEREVQLYGCEAVAKLSDHHEGNAVSFCMSGAYRFLKELLSTNLEDVELRSLAFEGVINILEQPTSCRDEMQEKGFWSVVIEGILAGSSINTKAKAWGCHWIAAEAQESEEMQDKLVKAGAIDLVMDFLSKYQEVPDMVVGVLDALLGLCHEKPNHTRQLTEIQATLIKILNNFPADAHVQEATFSFAALLLEDVTNQDIFAGLGLGHLALGALRDHVADAGVMLQVLRAVINLVTDHEENQVGLCEAGACKLMSAVVNAHGVSTAEAWQAIGLLAQDNPDYHSELASKEACDSLVVALRSEEASREVKLWGLRVTVVITADSQAVRNQLVDAGIVTGIAAALLTYPDDQELYQIGMEALATLNISEERLGTLQSDELAGLVQVLAYAITRFKDIPSLFQVAFGMMGHLVRTGALRQTTPLPGSDLVWSTLMTALLSHPDFQLLACSLIASWTACNPSAQHVLGQDHVYKLLLTLAQASPGDQRSQLQVMSALNSLITRNPQGQMALGTAGGCQWLCEVLERYRNESKVWLYGCALIANLAWNDPENQSRLGDIGACTLCCDGLLQAELDVAKQRLRAIQSLASNHSENQLRLGRDGACESLAKLLVDPQSEKSLAVKACKAIGSLAFCHTDNQERLWQLDTASSLINLMETWSKDPSSLAAACGALLNLGWKEERTEELALKVLPMVCAALRDMPQDEPLALNAVSLLAGLATCGESIRNNAGEQDVASLVCSVARQWPLQNSIQIACLKAIGQLTYKHPANQTIFGEVGAAGVISRALELLSEDPKGLLKALFALSSLARRHLINQSRLIDSKGAEHLMFALKRHSANDTIRLQGCDAIMFLAYRCPEARSALRAAGAVDYVTAVLRQLNTSLTPIIINHETMQDLPRERVSLALKYLEPPSGSSSSSSLPNWTLANLSILNLSQAIPGTPRS